MKKTLSLLILISVFGLTSCSNYHDVIVTGGGSAAKTGEVREVVWFNLAFNVDVSAAAAAKNGGITKISTVEHNVRKFLVNPYSLNKKFALKTTYVTRVTGE